MAVNRPKVLVAPLDWGLGHATRCIPVIRELQQQGAEVVIAAQGGGKSILRGTFPLMQFVDLPCFKVRYPARLPLSVSILLQIPSLHYSVLREHRQLEQLIDTLGITHVVSDNRFGLFSKKIPCVFMTHQVHISGGRSLNMLDPFLFRMNRYWIEKFDALWIPDVGPPDGLAAKLSDPSGIRIPWKWVGLLSRFNQRSIPSVMQYEVVAILSGPEPQRTAFETLLRSGLSESGKKCLIVRGIPGVESNESMGNTNRVPAASDDMIQGLLHPETILICRPGYSTLMDLAVLGHLKTIFIPTPGQTEQEYLAGELNRRFGYCIVKQGEPLPIEKVQAGEPIVPRPESGRNMLQEAVADLLSNR